MSYDNRLFDFGIEQIYVAHWEPQWLRVKYRDHEGWLWRNLRAYDEQYAVWIALEPLKGKHNVVR